MTIEKQDVINRINTEFKNDFLNNPKIVGEETEEKKLTALRESKQLKLDMDREYRCNNERRNLIITNNTLINVNNIRALYSLIYNSELNEQFNEKDLQDIEEQKNPLNANANEQHKIKNILKLIKTHNQTPSYLIFWLLNDKYLPYQFADNEGNKLIMFSPKLFKCNYFAGENDQIYLKVDSYEFPIQDLEKPNFYGIVRCNVSLTFKIREDAFGFELTDYVVNQNEDIKNLIERSESTLSDNEFANKYKFNEKDLFYNLYSATYYFLIKYKLKDEVEAFFEDNNVKNLSKEDKQRLYTYFNQLDAELFGKVLIKDQKSLLEKLSCDDNIKKDIMKTVYSITNKGMINHLNMVEIKQDYSTDFSRELAEFIKNSELEMDINLQLHQLFRLVNEGGRKSSHNFTGEEEENKKLLRNYTSIITNLEKEVNLKEILEKAKKFLITLRFSRFQMIKENIKQLIKECKEKEIPVNYAYTMLSVIDEKYMNDDLDELEVFSDQVNFSTDIVLKGLSTLENLIDSLSKTKDLLEASKGLYDDTRIADKLEDFNRHRLPYLDNIKNVSVSDFEKIDKETQSIPFEIVVNKYRKAHASLEEIIYGFNLQVAIYAKKVLTFMEGIVGGDNEKNYELLEDLTDTLIKIKILLDSKPSFSEVGVNDASLSNFNNACIACINKEQKYANSNSAEKKNLSLAMSGLMAALPNIQSNQKALSIFNQRINALKQEVTEERQMIVEAEKFLNEKIVNVKATLIRVVDNLRQLSTFYSRGERKNLTLAFAIDEVIHSAQTDKVENNDLDLLLNLTDALSKIDNLLICAKDNVNQKEFDNAYNACIKIGNAFNSPEKDKMEFVTAQLMTLIPNQNIDRQNESLQKYYQKIKISKNNPHLKSKLQNANHFMEQAVVNCYNANIKSISDMSGYEVDEQNSLYDYAKSVVDNVKKIKNENEHNIDTLLDLTDTLYKTKKLIDCTNALKANNDASTMDNFNKAYVACMEKENKYTSYTKMQKLGIALGVLAVVAVLAACIYFALPVFGVAVAAGAIASFAATTAVQATALSLGGAILTSSAGAAGAAIVKLFKPKSPKTKLGESLKELSKEARSRKPEPHDNH